MPKRILVVLTAFFAAMALAPAATAGPVDDGTGNQGTESSAVEAVAPEVDPSGVEPLQGCSSGYLCFWNRNNYQGGSGRLNISSRDWREFRQDDCPDNNWHNCASSIVNNGSCLVLVYAGIGYEGDVLPINRGVRIPVLRTEEMSNRISSNNWAC